MYKSIIGLVGVTTILAGAIYAGSRLERWRKKEVKQKSLDLLKYRIYCWHHLDRDYYHKLANQSNHPAEAEENNLFFAISANMKEAEELKEKILAKDKFADLRVYDEKSEFIFIRDCELKSRATTHREFKEYDMVHTILCIDDGVVQSTTAFSKLKVLPSRINLQVKFGEPPFALLLNSDPLPPPPNPPTTNVPIDFIPFDELV